MTKNPIVGALLRGVVIGALLGGAFAGGFLFRGAMPSLAANTAPDDPPLPAQAVEGQFPLLAQAQALLKDNYLRNMPDPAVQEYGAIRGLIGTLGDRLTYFIEPPVAASESNVLAGQYGGIGVQVRRDESGRFRLYPFRDGPAARAGLLDGDILLKVNGADVDTAISQDAADQLLRGEVKEGSGVTVDYGRENAGAIETRSLFVAFEVIEVPSVVWRTLAEAPTFGYIQILRFTSRTPEELNNAFTELRAAGIEALVLDMRNNPGGLLLESIQVASAFLPDDQVVLYERNRNGEKTYPVDNNSVILEKMLDLPMVVLVNGGSASAAELVSGALKDNGRATLIGQRTYGKWSIQLIFQLADKSSLHVTTGEFFPPSKAKLDGVGLDPDIPMIPDQNGRDVELGEAIRTLRAKIPA